MNAGCCEILPRVIAASVARASLIAGCLFGLALSTRAAEPATIVFFGDSITAGLGLADPDTQSYPALIGRMIAEEGLNYEIVNAGLSGDTTAGGLRRVDWTLQRKVDIFVIALGANDGLRGVPPETTRANLQGIIDRVHERYPEAKLILAGMMMPETLGPEFTTAFRELFPSLARKNDIALVPYLLEGVGGVPELNQGDQIHPNPRGHSIVAENVWKILRPLL